MQYVNFHSKVNPSMFHPPHIPAFSEADREVEFLVMPDLDGIWGNVLERGRLLRTWLFPSHFGKFSPSVLEIDA